MNLKKQAKRVGGTAAFFVFAFSLRAERYSLKQFQEAAEKSGNQLGEERAKVEYAEARLDYARGLALPTGSVESLFGVGPGAEGNALDGRTLWNRWGAVSITKVEIAQPLFAFGALGAARTAARAGVEAQQKLLERERWLLRNEIAELYYGYQLAFEFSEMAGDVASKLETALKKLNSSKKKREGDISKIKIFLAEAQVRQGEADKGMQQARMGMMWKLGRYPATSQASDEIRWDRANLVAREVAVKELAEYQSLAKLHRPELKALQKEIEAKSALVTAERAQLLPAFFIGARGEYAVAPRIQNQESPFANDPYNGFSVGVGLGLRWNLGFFERAGKVGMARAELIQAEAKTRHLGAGILAELEKNYLDFKHDAHALKLRQEASASAKKLYLDSMAQFALGAGDPKVMFENLGAFVSQEKSRLEALYAYNVALTKLEQVVGVEL